MTPRNVVRETVTTTRRTVGGGGANGADSKHGAAATEDVMPPDVSQVIAELGADAATVMLWRVDDPEEPYVGRVKAADFSLDWVLANYGGGKYRARVADTKHVWRKTITFAIAGPPRTPDPVTSSSSSGAPGGGGLPAWLQTVLIATLPVVAGAIAKKMLEKPEADPLILALLSKTGRGEQVSAVELATMLDNARKDARDEAREVAELVAERGGRDGPAGWADVVRDSLPPILETFRREQVRERPPRARVVATPAATTTGEPVRSTDAAAPDNEPRWIRRVRPYVGTIVRWADSGKQPEVKADNVLDDLDAGDADDLGTHALSPTFVADVFAALRELGATPARREWFTVFLERLQASFEPAPPDAGDEDNGVSGAEEASRAEGHGDVSRPPATSGSAAANG